MTLLAWANCITLFAQVKFSTIVNEKQPSLDDVVQVEYTVENAKTVDKIEMPSFINFRVVQGPIQSNGMSYMNGVLSQYKSISFILQPLLKGRLVVPGSTAIIDGKAMKSESVAILVSNSGRGAGSGNVSPGLSRMFPQVKPEVEEEYILKPGESMTEKIKDNLFVKTDVNKTTCYEGEPIMATFKLFSRLKSESKVLKRPSLNGFSVFDMVEPEANLPTVQSIKGRLFNAHLIRQTQLFPLQAGTFIIDPVELDNTVKFIRTKSRERGSLNPMEQFLEEFSNEGVRGEVEEHTFSLASKPVTITVKPLPVVNKPASFNGAVGKFTMQADVKNKMVNVGEEFSLQVKIEGKGNFTVINAPQVLLPESMEGYDPAVKENVDKSVYPLSGY
ncbi:MAG: BatD family protein, partial [Chitinophagaceae bacterium]